MQRREFITLLGGAAAAWPLVAYAQQAERIRRVGVLSALAEDDPESVTRRAVFEQALKALGWTNGSNLRVDYRWSSGDADRGRKLAAELVALAPDVVLTSGNIALTPMMQATRTIPIVFVQAVDPVGSGFVESLARPGGNAQRDACGGHSGSHARPWDRPVRRGPGHSAVARDGVEPDQFTRCLGNGTRDRGIRALPQRRANRDSGRNCV
jgi:hypothetical protein